MFNGKTVHSVCLLVFQRKYRINNDAEAKVKLSDGNIEEEKYSVKAVVDRYETSPVVESVVNRGAKTEKRNCGKFQR